jgi:S1-C subfamily serine protease
LALLRADGVQSPSFARLRNSPDVRLGEEVIALGYPLGDLLGSGLKVTTGNVSALTGVANNNSGELQFTAPIQPGSSGGPLLDSSGLVIGIVSSKLSEAAMIRAAGSLPQNINFAIRSQAIDAFLASNGVEREAKSRGARLTAKEIAAQAARTSFRSRAEGTEANLSQPLER